MEIRPTSELQIQSAAWREVWKLYPDLRRCFFHIPNESTYNNGQQASSGVIAGIQDMFLLCKCNAWLIELKDEKGRISDAQKVVHAIHKRQGFDTYIFRDSDDLVEFITDIVNEDERFVRTAWLENISPYSVSEDYEKLLAEYQAKKKARK